MSVFYKPRECECVERCESAVRAKQRIALITHVCEQEVIATSRMYVRNTPHGSGLISFRARRLCEDSYCTECSLE